MPLVLPYCLLHWGLLASLASYRHDKLWILTTDKPDDEIDCYSFKSVTGVWVE
ncbi:hypothetical protein [Brasilonema sp. UFV-L1]|uniref:hypothetical protein n=1 Tax=Brasilonema sp. UFV-L1 TaxID=2234130 RepID=UPI00145E78E3|nr:hypothetical protein [Brasilonema sp. UFV-L1]